MTTRLGKRISRRRWLKKARVVVASILLLVAIAAGASYVIVSGSLRANLDKDRGFITSPHKVNILVLGVDQREDDQGRSDTTILITIDTSTKEAKILSIPRDTRVKIPDHGWDKVNHAYAYGKATLSQKSIEDFLGIPIDYYIELNFSGFTKLVDAIGGVDIDVEKRMAYSDPYDKLVIDLYPGMQHMDGKTALEYVRYRDDQGDIGRVSRQQKFINQVVKQVVRPATLIRVPAVIQEVVGLFNTNMSTAEMLNLAEVINIDQTQGIQADMVPGRAAYINDVSYWLPDILATRQHVAEMEGSVLSDNDLLEAKRLALEFDQSVPKEIKVLQVPKEEKKGSSETNISSTQGSNKGSDSDTFSAKITVSVINASGTASEGSTIAGILRARGFEVQSVANSIGVENNTLVISNTTSSVVVGKLTGLPFKYSLQVTKDDSKATLVTVIIGKDAHL